MIGGGPTGVELAGALAEISRETHRPRLPPDRPDARRASCCSRAAPACWPPSPIRLPARAAAALARIGVEVRTGATVTRVDPATRSGSAASRSARAPCCGPPEWPPRRSTRTLGVPLDRAGRVHRRARPLASPATPRSSSSATSAPSPREDGRPLPGLAPVAIQQGRARRRATCCTASPASRPSRSTTATTARMATIGRAAAVAEVGRLRLSRPPRLARLALRPHHLPDRLPQPLPRPLRVGLGLPQLAARRPPHHRAPGARRH